MIMQGFALRVSHQDIGTERFPDTIKRVLTGPSFSAAALQLSVKLRARPRTPTQEATGEICLLYSACPAIKPLTFNCSKINLAYRTPNCVLRVDCQTKSCCEDKEPKLSCMCCTQIGWSTCWPRAGRRTSARQTRICHSLCGCRWTSGPPVWARRLFCCMQHSRS